MTTTDLSKYHELYIQATQDSLKQMEQYLLEKNKFELFRLVHSLKSRSFFMGYNQLGNLYRFFEQLMLPIKEDKKELTPGIISLINDVINFTKDSLNNIKADQPELNSQELVKKISSYI